MKLQTDPQTEDEQAIVDAVLEALNEVDPTKDLYNRDSIYFNTDDTSGQDIAVVRFESFPTIPETEFGSGKSSLQMKEELEREIMDALPSNIAIERNTKLEFGFYSE